MTMNTGAVLFDKDGTLFDFFATFGHAVYHVFDELSGGDLAAMRQMAKYSKYDLDKRQIALDSPLVSEQTVFYGQVWAEILQSPFDAAFANSIDRLFRIHSRANITVFPQTKPVLAALAARGLPLGVATNDSEAGARDHLAAAGVEDQFCFLAGYDSGFGSKPEPGQIHAFADHLNMTCKRLVMVGDSPHDLAAAKAAGAKAIGVTTGAATAQELRPFADHVIASLDELPPLV